MHKLLLIDGNAVMHRAFHALPSLMSSHGEMTNAVYGFFSMFLNVLKDQHPTHVIVCFDRPAPTFRQELYVGYHQHRPAMSDDLSPQFPKVHEALEKMCVTIFEVDGYEADDVLGTLSVQAVQKDPEMEVVILTGDRDLMQLVNKKVRILMPIVGVKTTLLYDEARVQEKFGVTPAQFIDYKALIGDASDGYPGVSGIGPKTAANLLQKYNTFENLYENIEKLPERVGEKLATDAEQAALAKRLATIVLDVPIKLSIDACSVGKCDLNGLKEAFERFGFQSLLVRFQEAFTRAETAKKDKTPDDGQMSLL